MADKVIVSGSLIPSSGDSPLDFRTRINTIGEVEGILSPFVGMQFYVMDEEKFYVVKSLKAKVVGNITVENALVDEYEALINIDLNDVQVDMTDVATKQFVEEQIGAIEHPQYDDSELKERLDVLEAIDHEEFLKEHQDISHLVAKEDIAEFKEKYKIDKVPEGTLIDYREKEIRVMIPADADFSKNNGVFAGENLFCVELSIYAPEGAVSHKTNFNGTIMEGLVENFANNRGEFGRIPIGTCPPVAYYDSQSAKWVYYGAKSTTDKYIGWNCSVQWFDENGVVMASDHIRINLSNEECHNELFPYLGAPIASKVFVEEQIAQIELLEGPQGPQGEAGQDGKDGVDGKDFTYDMFTEEQLERLIGPQGPEGLKGDPGEDGVGVESVEILDGHLMVHLSNNTVVDAGELPVGEGGSGEGANQEELDALQVELAETKQKLLDLTYGVDYEWIYFYDQVDAATDELGFNQQTAPGFYEDWLPVLETGDEALIEEFVVRMYEEDIYRMYVMKVASEHRIYNRYELLPLEGHSVQPENEWLKNWEPTQTVDAWNWGGEEDGSFSLVGKPISAMSFAFLKVKK